MISPRGGDFYLATSGDRNLAVDTAAEVLDEGMSGGKDPRGAVAL